MSIEEKITHENSEKDPLENDAQNDDEKIVQNEVENAVEITEDLRNVAGIGMEDDSEDFTEDSENGSEDSSEDDWEAAGNYSGDETEDSENDWEEPEIDTEESDEDPLGVEEDETIYVDAEEYAEDLGIAKDLKELIDDCGLLMIESLDEAKVNMCVAIGGGHPSQYAAKPKLRKKLYESIELVLKHKDFSLPTPGQTVLGILAMMVLPPLGMAVVHKYMGRNTDKSPAYKEPASTEESDQVDYSQTKEYQSGRTRFITFSTGMYQYDSKGKYIESKYADDGPSAEIQKLLNEGKTSPQIKDIVYGGKK